MRKILLCAIAALFGPMASVSAADIELRFTHATTGGKTKEVLDGIIADFEKTNPGVKIKQIVYDDDLYSDTGLITQLKSSQPPDIYFQWAGYPVRRDAEGGFAMDLSAAMAEGGWKESFVPSVWSEGAGTTWQGRPYMVPISIDVTTVLWFGKEAFDEAGVGVPANWQDFVAAVKKLAESGTTPIVVGNQELWPLGNWAAHITSRVVPPDIYEAAFRQEQKFNQPAFEKAFLLLEELREAGAFNKDMPGLGADPAMSTFFQGAAAMHPIGSWLVSSAGELAEKDFAYDQFNTPLIDPAHPMKDSVIGTITGYIVHKDSAHPKEAIAFLRFFASPENQIKWAEAGTISPVKGVMEKAALDEKTKALAALLANSGSLASPPDTTYPVPVAEAFYQAAAYVAGGEKSPKDALVWLDETVATIGKQ